MARTDPAAARPVRPPQDLIDRLAATEVPGISPHDRDEMAIPSHTHSNPLIRWLMWRRYEAIGALLGDGRGAALEFGCGMGLFLPSLAARFDRVYATDLFPQHAQALAAELGVKVDFVAGLEDVPDGALDAIVAADVMEHLDDPAAFARRFRAKLAPGGRLVVSGPTESVVYRLGRVVAGFAGKGDYHHTNIVKLAELIAGSGFTLVEKRVLPFPWAPSLFHVLAYAAR